MVEALIIQFPENGNHLESLTGRIIPKTKNAKKTTTILKQTQI